MRQYIKISNILKKKMLKKKMLKAAK